MLIGLTKDQKDRVSLIKSMSGGEISKKEALEALELNNWDTAMALEWIEAKKINPNVKIEDFHIGYADERKKSVELPTDRYDLEPSKKASEEPVNREQRRAQAKKKNKKK